MGARALRRVQGDVHRVGVAAKVAAGLEQRHGGMGPQPVCGGQAGNAGTNNCDFHKEFAIIWLLYGNFATMQ